MSAEGRDRPAAAEGRCHSGRNPAKGNKDDWVMAALVLTPLSCHRGIGSTHGERCPTESWLQG